jgi:hypothetical protein
MVQPETMPSRFAGLLGLALLPCVAMLLPMVSLASCRAQQLDPVQGPMALEAPGPFYEGLKGHGAYAYSIRSDFGRVRAFTYADGETLKGKCESVTAPSADAAATPDGNSPQPSLAAVWDLVNGPGYYAAHVQGNKVLHGLFKGDKGATLEVESLDNFVAVGEDNRGNLYKIVW